MPTYVQQRRRRWYAVLEIPQPLRKRLGRARFVKSLETDSRAVALRRAAPLVAQWKSQIDTARGEPNTNDVAYWRRALKGASDEAERRAIEEAMETQLWRQGYEKTDPETAEFFTAAYSAGTLDQLEDWLANTKGVPKTLEMHRDAVTRFAKVHPVVARVTRRDAQLWVNSLANDEDLAPATIRRLVGSVRTYWRYLESLEVTDSDPFRRLEVPKKPRPVRQPFEPKDVVKLLEAAKGDGQLADLITLGMWTGCRIEELCALKVEHVHKGYFEVVDAKTPAGGRTVPIHPKLRGPLVRLVKDSEDGYVLSGLTVNKYGDRSNAIGKRFGRLRERLGYGREHVFHSIRKTVVTILENAGVAENVVADLVGHEKRTITYGLYSGGVSLEVKRRALGKLCYPM